MYAKKYKKGVPIKSVSRAVDLIWNKKKFIFHNHKPLHYGWTSSWSIMSIYRYIRLGQLFTARRIK